MRVFSILGLLLLPAATWGQEATLSVDCSSIARILANPTACDNRPVRLDGKVFQFKLRTSKQGKPYTEFILVHGSETIAFFSYDHLPLQTGMCVQVEGVYHWQREVGASTFKSEVVVEKKSEGVAGVPCPPEDKQLQGRQKAKGALRGSSPATWSWEQIFGVGILILFVLAAAASRMLTPGHRHRMGRAFEEYVIGLFPDTEWEIEDRSSDTSHRIGRRVTGDVSYDCIVKYRRNSQRFILQCKYRSQFFRRDDREGIEWAKPYQIQNYSNFQRTKGWPYLVIIGVGGHPKQPHQLFAFPLGRLGHPFIERSELLAAKRDPHALFTVDDQGLFR